MLELLAIFATAATASAAVLGLVELIDRPAGTKKCRTRSGARARQAGKFSS